MRLYHLRNATFVIQAGIRHFLVDPMLGTKGALPPYAWFRHACRRNPLVDLPDNASQVIEAVTHCLVTHSQKWGLSVLTHTDHFDRAGRDFLRNKRIPVICPAGDRAYMEKQGLAVTAAPEYWETQDIDGGRVTAVPARHGHGWIHSLMANGAGFFLELEGEPSIYISGDTVLTGEVTAALARFRPDIAVVAGGSAGLDIGGPILMPPEEILSFIELAPGRGVVNHLEALNHCPTTREWVSRACEASGLAGRVWIPGDGESRDFGQG